MISEQSEEAGQHKIASVAAEAQANLALQHQQFHLHQRTVLVHPEMRQDEAEAAAIAAAQVEQRTSAAMAQATARMEEGARQLQTQIDELTEDARLAQSIPGGQSPNDSGRRDSRSRSPLPSRLNDQDDGHLYASPGAAIPATQLEIEGPPTQSASAWLTPVCDAVSVEMVSPTIAGCQGYNIS